MGSTKITPSTSNSESLTKAITCISDTGPSYSPTKKLFPVPDMYAKLDINNLHYTLINIFFF